MGAQAVNRLDGWAGAMYVVIGAIVGFAFAFIVRPDPPTTPFPCGRHEVAVWADYPDTISCVPDTDHAHHGGA